MANLWVIRPVEDLQGRCHKVCNLRGSLRPLRTPCLPTRQCLYHTYTNINSHPWLKAFRDLIPPFLGFLGHHHPMLIYRISFNYPTHFLFLNLNFRCHRRPRHHPEDLLPRAF